MLVGITGRAGSGKDTIGNILRQNHGFETRAFATPIKRAVSGLLNVDIDQWNDRVWKEATLDPYGKSPRELAQLFGTEFGRRMINSELWVMLGLSDLENNKVAVTDVRFPNEARAIRQLGGSIIHLRRNSTQDRTLADAHESERGVDIGVGDFHINNYRAIADLIPQVAVIVETLETEALPPPEPQASLDVAEAPVEEV